MPLQYEPQEERRKRGEGNSGLPRRFSIKHKKSVQMQGPVCGAELTWGERGQTRAQVEERRKRGVGGGSRLPRLIMTKPA